MKKPQAFTAQSRGEGLLRIHFLWLGGIFGPSSFGTRTIKSVNSQPSTSQILSSCSRLTRVATSWYNSLIVLGHMPVLRARSACVHLSSPSRVDSNILIIGQSPLWWSLAYTVTNFSDLLDNIDYR